jgi:putative Mg2+ transporter-C (MgtC) family protein
MLEGISTVFAGGQSGIAIGRKAMDMLTIGLRLCVALILGSAIGVERQWYQKMAGLRTNALVALGAAGYVAFSAMAERGDPTRVAGQVVSGIGFLGAGVILREGINVTGINTAATLWCSAMVGTLAGGGYLAESALAASLVLATNFLLRPLVRRLNRRTLTGTDTETYYTVEVTCRAAEEAHIRALLLHALSGGALGLRQINSEDIPGTPNVAVTANAVSGAQNNSVLEQIVGRLSLEPYVSAAKWRIERAIMDA